MAGGLETCFQETVGITNWKNIFEKKHGSKSEAQELPSQKVEHSLKFKGNICIDYMHKIEYKISYLSLFKKLVSQYCMVFR